jgi:3-oxoacyl-[acyl-carrier protein] reductase
MALTAQIRGPALVTGGGQGLGRAFCLALGKCGVPVAIADLNGERAAAVADEVKAAGGSAVSCTVDVSNEASVEKMANAVRDAFGDIAVLVNNAAIFSALVMRGFVEIPPDEWRRVLDVNVTGAFLCSRAVVPAMIEAGYGKIINISSATVWTGRPNYLHYVTSKAALIGFTRSLATEVGSHGIRVNAITPGSTKTEIERMTITPAARESMAQATALRRVQVPEDLTGTVIFLASTSSDFITGQTINVDGGFAFH